MTDKVHQSLTSQPAMSHLSACTGSLVSVRANASQKHTRAETHTLDTFSVPLDRAGRPGRSLWSCALWTFFRSKLWMIIRQPSPFLTTRECLKSGLTLETKNPKYHYKTNIHRHFNIDSLIDVPCQDVAEWSGYLDLAPSSFPDSPCT